jgi:hypothetical protein
VPSSPAEAPLPAVDQLLGVIWGKIEFSIRVLMRPIYAFFFSLAVLGYLGSFSYLMDYLRRVHFSIWAELGQPEFPAQRSNDDSLQSTGSVFLTFGFVFSNRHKHPADLKLTALIWLIRILFVLSLLLFAGIFYLH